MTTRGIINSNFYQIVNVDANGNPISLTSAIIANSNINSNTANYANYANYAGNATIANVANSVAVANVVGIGNIATVNLNGNSTQVLYGNGVFATVGNGNYAVNANYANYAGNAFAVSVGNVSGIGNIATINLNGSTSQVLYGNGVFANVGNGNYAVNANYANFAGNAFAVSGSNVSGQVANALIAGTVYTNAQPNITSVGTLSILSVTGNITAGNVSGGNLVSANYISGNGSLLTGITSTTGNANYANYAGNAYAVNGSNVSGQVANALVAGTVYTNSQPNITSVGTLTSLSVTGNITAGNVSGGNLVSANYISGNGSLLTAITGANVTGYVPNANIANTAYAVSGSNVSGQVANALVAGTVYTNAQPNITSVGTLTGLTSSANITAPYFLGNVVGNISGNIVVPGTQWDILYNNNGNAGASDRLQFNANTNILTANGNIVANYYSGNGSGLTAITGANVSGQVANALIAGTVYTNSQPNITSVGTLTSLSVTGNITAGNVSGGNLVSANYISGNGSLLTAITGANVTGIVGNATHANYADTANSVAGANVTGQVANALVAGTVYTNAQPNITSVGNLTTLTVSGNTIIAGNLIVTGNIEYIDSNVIYMEAPIITLGGGPNGNALTNNDGMDRGSVLDYYTTQPVSAFMGWKNGNSEFEFGSNVSVSNNVVTINTYGNIKAGSANLGNSVTSNYFIGNGSLLTGLTSLSVANANYANYAGNAYSVTGSNVTGQVANALIAGTVYTNAQPNITSVGTLTSLAVTGNLTAGNVAGGNLVSANYISGNGSGLTSITGANVTGYVSNANIANTAYAVSGSNVTGQVANANYAAYAGNAYAVTGSNVSGQVANALVAGTVYTNAQPNITSVGTLTTLSITGNLTAGNVSGGNLVSANYISGNGYLLTGITSTTGNANYANYAGNAYSVTGSNVSGQVANALVAGTVYTNAQPNITSVGTLSSLSVTGNITAGNVSGGNLVSANYISGNGYLLTGITSTTGNANYANYAGNAYSVTGSNVSGQVANALVAGTVYTNSQPNITSVGTLSSLSVTANITAGNVSGGNLVSANYISGNGSLLTGVVASSATTAVTVTGNSQPNITSVGTLSSLSVTANITAGNVSGGNLVSANYISGNGSLLTSITGANVTGQVANALIAGTVYTNAQPNVTSVGTLTGMNIAGSSGNVFLGYDSSNYALGKFIGNVNNYAQLGFYNANTGTLASADFAIYDTVGVTSANFIDMGVQSNTYSNSSWTINGPSDAYIYTGGTSNLAIGTQGSTTNLVFFTGNSLSSNERLRIVNTGNIGINQTNPAYTLDTTGNIRATGNIISNNYFVGNGYYLTGISGGGGGTPGGSNTSVQFNNSGAFGGDGYFTYISGVNPALSLATTNLHSATFNLNAGTLGVSNIVGGPGGLTLNTNAGISINPTGNANINGSNINFTTSGNVNLGSNSNIKITGGTSGYYLQTDGTGNLSWAAGGGGGGNGTPGGTDTDVQFNQTGNFAGSANLTFNYSTNTLSATYFSGDGSNLANLAAQGGTGAIQYANSAGVITGNSSVLTFTTAPSTLSVIAPSSGITLTRSAIINLNTSIGNANIIRAYTSNSLTITDAANILLVAPNVNLGSNSNVKITGGSSGQYLSTDGTGNLSWAAGGGGSTNTDYTASFLLGGM